MHHQVRHHPTRNNLHKPTTMQGLPTPKVRNRNIKALRMTTTARNHNTITAATMVPNKAVDITHHSRVCTTNRADHKEAIMEIRGAKEARHS